MGRNKDREQLGDMFGVNVAARRTARRKAPRTRTYHFKGRVANVEQQGSEWVGWFDDEDHTTLIASTLGELLADLEASA